MYYSKLIRYLYLGLTIFALICPVKISFLDFLPGLILMWFFYFLFAFAQKTKSCVIDTKSTCFYYSNKLTLIVTFSYLVFYPLYIHFYTGLNILTVLINVRSGISNYYLYQSYFEDTALNVFSFNKIPFILLHGFLRFMFIAIVFRTIVYKVKPTFIDKILISIMVLIIVIVGLARGTSFEFFELFLIFLFAFVSKTNLSGHKYLLPRKLLIKSSVLVLSLILYFIYNINIRMGGDFSFFNDPFFDKDSVIYHISKSAALILYSLNDYFLFGIYFSSIAITKLWFSSYLGFLSTFIPNGIKLFGIDSGYRDFVSRFIDLGARWNSDSMVFVESYGIIFTFIFIFFIGRFSKQLYSQINSNLPALILLFYVFYIFVSLPIGNFITSSSANMISILTAYIFYKCDKINFFVFEKE